MSRRRGGSYLQGFDIKSKVVRVFNTRISEIAKPYVEAAITELAESKNKEALPLIAALEAYNKAKRAEIGLSPSRSESVVSLYDDSINRNNEIGSFVVKHPMVLGDNPFPELRTMGSWSSSLSIKLLRGDVFGVEAPWSIRDSTLTEAESESLDNIYGHLGVIVRELHPWLQQFGNMHDSASFAAYYSATMRQWLTSLGYGTRTYLTRPRFSYQIPMSSELNTALTIGLQLRAAQRAV